MAAIKRSTQTYWRFTMVGRSSASTPGSCAADSRFIG